MTVKEIILQEEVMIIIPIKFLINRNIYELYKYFILL